MTDEARIRRVLTVAAVSLAVVAPLAGSPFVRDHGRVDVARLARAVEREEDHVSAIELARWIRERREGLRVIDVRSPEEYADYHVPTAERAPLDSVVRMPFAPGETIVLYSEGGAHAAQAWVLLRALGHEHVYFLRGGLYEWLKGVMNPSLAANASDTARVEFARTSELSRYFGGKPRMLEPGDTSVSDAVPLPAASASDAKRGATTTLVRAIRRRGC